MKKIVILTAILVLVSAGTSYATLASGPRITYGGLLEVDPSSGGVIIDTLICVFNPNKCNLRKVKIHVFDKYGEKLISTELLNGGPTPILKRKGWVWITLGMLGLEIEPGAATKLTWVVTWNPPPCTPNRGAVIEVKEIVYDMPIIYDDTHSVWTEMKWAHTMSEAALGFYGVGYAPQ